MIAARRTAFGLAAMLAAVAGAPAFAASCTISSSGVNFGSYDPVDAVDTRGAGTIHLGCDAPVNANVALVGGGRSAVDHAMSNGSSQLVYDLYVDPQRSTRWGDGTAGSQTLPFDGTAADRPIYGSITARQRVTAGSYTDTIMLTVTY